MSMYSEWASVQQEIQSDDSNTSVLHSFPQAVGKDVASAVVKNLAQTLSLGAANSEPSNLKTAKQVRWTMEVLCYGLSLPFTENDTIRDCVNVYCEWLSALTVAKVCVPPPVEQDPNPYVCEMLHHLYNLFVPRPDPPATNQNPKAMAADFVKRQALLCHRVLRQIHSAAGDSNVMTRETWECLLKFLLAVNDTLLAPPIKRDGIGENLCDRVLSVLFQLWLLACERCFPSPPLWKTFRDMCANWRHHDALISQWHRVNVSLTSRLLKTMFGPDYPELYVSNDDLSLIPEGMDEDCIAQCWFRMLHILSNPVDLCRPLVISNTPKFLHMALTSEAVIDPHQHECLRALPQIFLCAMKSISVLVDAFLGISDKSPDLDSLTSFSAGSRQTVAMGTGSTGFTPPQQRKVKAFGQHGNKGGTKGSSLLTPSKQPSSAASTPSSSPQLLTLNSRPPLALTRPKVNSILHLFGAWLVEAAIAGVKVQGSEQVALTRSRTASFIEHSRPDLLPDGVLAEPGALLPPQSYEEGRAEACGALCRIFCSHKTAEEILPTYLSRFYIALYYGLETEETPSGTVLASIIFNSCDLLRVDLDGVNIVAPQLLKALELILSELTPRLRWPEHIPSVELRKASIHLLLSLLSLPLHFKNLPIRDMFGVPMDPPVTFLSLKTRLMELLLRALTIETDSTNTQMLLGGLMMCVQDLALCEEAEHTTVQAEQGAPPSPSQVDSTPDSAHGLFGHAASLVCNRLMATWKVELNIALAAIEVLSGLAKVRLATPNLLMGKRTVNWVCEFIVYQCSRPAPAHSKDLHSMIVAAFHCLSLWLVEHDYLMTDRECLHCVLEVVELGISGSKSQPSVPEGPVPVPESPDHSSKHKHDKESRRVLVDSEDQNRASDRPKLKGDKELKPVSMRVKDAAESLLTTIMDHVGSFPPPCGPESVCSLLDEDSLLKYCKDGGLPEQGTPFRYFVLDGSTIVGLLEQPLGNDEDPLPTVTALIRGPFGRHAWTMQLRHVPRNKKVGSRAALSEPSRPAPDDNVGTVHNVKHRYFPEIVDTIPKVQADKSIPPLESTMTHYANELEKLEDFIEQQIAFENRVKQRVAEEKKNAPYPNPEQECKPPSICHEFQTARLFLSHYGFLSLEALKDPPNSSFPPALVMLDTTQAGLLQDLEHLDALPCRLTDTIHVFYVKSGQKMPFEILSNVTNKVHVQPTFLEFLRSLGWPVDVKKHAGWTGHTATSWKMIPSDEEESYPADTGGSLYDGRKQILYWADVLSEVAVVVPSPDTYQPMERRNSFDSNPAARCQPGLSPTDSSTKRKRHTLALLCNLGSTSQLLLRRRSRTAVVSAYFESPEREHPYVTPQTQRPLSPNLSTPPRQTLGLTGSTRSHRSASSKTGGGYSVSPLGTPPRHHQFPRDKPVPGGPPSSTPAGNAPPDGASRPTAARPMELAATKPKSLSLDLEQQPALKPSGGQGARSTDSPATPTDAGSNRAIRRSGRFSTWAALADTKVFVVWLESFEDAENFPSGDLLPSTNTGLELNAGSSNSSIGRQGEAPVYIIFIHALANGLFRLHLRGQTGRVSMAIPLVDGMVVSRRSLGVLVRQTAINICRRRRLENDAFQPPHCRRKSKIKEIMDKYRNKLIEPEFYTALFQDVNK